MKASSSSDQQPGIDGAAQGLVVDQPLTARRSKKPSKKPAASAIGVPGESTRAEQVC